MFTKSNAECVFMLLSNKSQSSWQSTVNSSILLIAFTVSLLFNVNFGQRKSNLRMSEQRYCGIFQKFSCMYFVTIGEKFLQYCKILRHDRKYGSEG